MHNTPYHVAILHFFFIKVLHWTWQKLIMPYQTILFLCSHNLLNSTFCPHLKNSKFFIYICIQYQSKYNDLGFISFRTSWQIRFLRLMDVRTFVKSILVGNSKSFFSSKRTSLRVYHHLSEMLSIILVQKFEKEDRKKLSNAAIFHT